MWWSNFLHILSLLQQLPKFVNPFLGIQTVPAQFRVRRAPNCWRSLKGVYLTKPTSFLPSRLTCVCCGTLPKKTQKKEDTTFEWFRMTMIFHGGQSNTFWKSWTSGYKWSSWGIHLKIQAWCGNDVFRHKFTTSFPSFTSATQIVKKPWTHPWLPTLNYS